MCYKHFTGFGIPAILLACLAGPLGKSVNKYMLLLLDIPIFSLILLSNILIDGVILN